VIASDGRPGEGASPLLLDLDAAEVEEGPFGHMLEDRRLRPVLLGALADTPGITHLAQETVVAQQVHPGHVTVHLASGDVIGARLLIGADGRQSGTAKRAGIGRIGWDYAQDALVCAVSHEKHHGGVAHQFFMPGGPLAILPLPGGHRSSIVWSEKRALAQQIAAGSDAEFLAALRPRFGEFLGEIALAGARYGYPLNLTMAKSTVAERVALIGDAAQGVHPIAGQGLNQGLRDVATLAQVLAEARRRGEDIGGPQVLERYRAWRSFDRAGLALATDAFNRLFSNDNPVLRLGRDLGMAAVTAAPGLRRRFMREAAGLTGDVPRLLQGLPA
jgi:2-octaprenyl-6-methoxyphenol hydroxylase